MSPGTARAPADVAGGSTRAQFLKRAALSGVAVSATASVLAACSSDDGVSSSDAAGGTAAGGTVKANIADELKGKTIGVPIYSLVDENQSTLVKYLEEASEVAGLDWKFITDDTKADQGAAQSALQSYITRNVDGIIDITVPAASVEAQFAAAKDAGIPIIGTYTFAEFSPSILADYSAPLDHDGVLMSHYIVNDQVRVRGRDTVKVAMLDAPLDVVSPRRWIFEAIVANSEGIEIVEQDFNVSLTDTVADATKRAQALVQKNPDLSCIWCNYPPIAVPAASGVAQSGKDDIQVYGHIAGSGGVEAVRDAGNPMVATTWFDLAYNSYGMVDLMLAALAGEEVDRQASYLSPIPDAVFDEANVGIEVPEGTDAADWKFAGGSWQNGFVARWNESYGA